MGAADREETRRLDLYLWLGVAVAFSRVLVDLAQSLTETDAFWSILLPIPLMALCAARGTPRAAEPAPGGASLLLLALALNLGGTVLDTWTLARLGLPVAILGISRFTGQPALAAAVMGFWLVPVPSSVLAMTTPWAETAFASAAAATAKALLGAPVEAVGPLVQTPSDRLMFSAKHSGLPLAVALALLAWFAALRRGRGIAGAAAAAALGGASAFPVQAFGALVAVLLLCVGRPDLGLAVVDWGLAAACAAVVVAWTELPVLRA